MVTKAEKKKLERISEIQRSLASRIRHSKDADKKREFRTQKKDLDDERYYIKKKAERRDKILKPIERFTTPETSGRVPFTPPKSKFNLQKFGKNVAGLVTGGIAASRKGAGRGRPEGSFKPRVLPNGQIVSVPTQVFNEMKRAQINEMRLQREVKLARMAANAPMDHVRGGGGADDAWLMAEDFTPQQSMGGYPGEVPMEMEQEGPSALDKLKMGLARFGSRGRPMMGGGGFGSQIDPYGQTGPNIQGYPERPAMAAGPNGTPRLNIWGGPSSILRTPGRFNNPGETQVRP